jgi:hypothetical protein
MAHEFVLYANRGTDCSSLGGPAQIAISRGRSPKSSYYFPVIDPYLFAAIIAQPLGFDQEQ